MKEIKLSKRGKHGKSEFVALVDDEDFERINRLNWRVYKNHNVYYAIRSQRIENKRKYEAMHRVVLGISEKNVFVDHKDGNGLNNQKDNLRICTNSQNQYNRDSSKKSASKYKGVFREPIGRKKIWRAMINANKVSHHLGHFDTQEEAALAYNKAAKRLHGEFARLNKIQ